MNTAYAPATGRLRSPAGKANRNKMAKLKNKKPQKALSQMVDVVQVWVTLALHIVRTYSWGQKQTTYYSFFLCVTWRSVMQNIERVRGVLILLSFYLTNSSVYHDCKAVPGEFIKRKSNAQVREIVLLKYGKSSCSYLTGNVEVSRPIYAKKTLFKKGKLSLVAQVSLSTVRKTFPDFWLKHLEMLFQMLKWFN